MNHKNLFVSRIRRYISAFSAAFACCCLAAPAVFPSVCLAETTDSAAYVSNILANVLQAVFLLALFALVCSVVYFLKKGNKKLATLLCAATIVFLFVCSGVSSCISSGDSETTSAEDASEASAEDTSESSAEDSSEDALETSAEDSSAASAEDASGTSAEDGTDTGSAEGSTDDSSSEDNTDSTPAFKSSDD